MKTLRALSFALGLLSATAVPLRAGLDFTLHARQTGDSTPGPDNQYISDGDNHIYVHIPHGWTTSGGGDQLVLVPSQTGSEVVIRRLSGPPALPLDPAGLDVLRKNAQGLIPQGAKNIKPAGEVNDLLPILGWKSFEATFDYDFFGRPVRRSVLYINMLPGRVVQVNVTASQEDFEKVHEKVRQFMFNWFEPKRDLNPDAAREYEEGGYKGS